MIESVASIDTVFCGLLVLVVAVLCRKDFFLSDFFLCHKD